MSGQRLHTGAFGIGGAGGMAVRREVSIGRTTQQHNPAAGVQATLTLTGASNLRWVLDECVWRLLSRGTADIQQAQVVDNATTIWAARMQVTATAGDTDETRLGPLSAIMAGVGLNMIIRFGAAPAAANFEVVSFTAYQIPG